VVASALWWSPRCWCSCSSWAWLIWRLRSSARALRSSCSFLWSCRCQSMCSSRCSSSLHYLKWSAALEGRCRGASEIGVGGRAAAGVSCSAPSPCVLDKLSLCSSSRRRSPCAAWLCNNPGRCKASRVGT
jgi:hypothetical protein